ncbi:flagellin N-terminal-like domain-containing protein [Methanococcoides vulcani]|uniref:Flagellin N-terminal-like domain-containing protein n=1 Tax=Methanococcoides vulcani TaxID=1353158 RepID=A0A1H9Y909_9EURY|nr:type IV pilin N-terminal domain-containing protein [Methanococcoides vulcani]SES64921.1 flagellin N-terminal-like domain-containing protein [Methanococcoides vulcani]
MKIENMFNNEKGTSPVIGVMLMVVVTVILAAAVSSYSSGMIETTEAAPMGVFDVTIEKDAAPVSGMTPVSYMEIKHVTGDSMQTKDIKIMTIDANGTVTEILPNVINAEYYYVWGGTVYDKTAGIPHWNNPAYGYSGSPETNFGNYTLRPGVTMSAATYDNYVADPTTPMDVMFSDWENVEEGDFVNVKIVHIPSQKVIFQTNVEVI